MLGAFRAFANHGSLTRASARTREHHLEVGRVALERWMAFLEVGVGKTT